MVPNIHPAASVEWTLGNEVLKQVDSTSRVNESTKLTTITSTVALTGAWENHNEVLSCRASNMEGQTGKSDNVTLDVKVLPTKSSLHLSNENHPLADGRTAKITARSGKPYIFFFERTVPDQKLPSTATLVKSAYKPSSQQQEVKTS